MFKFLKSLYTKVKNLNLTINEYKQETIVQSLPAVAYVNKAKKYFDKGDFDTAEELLKKSLELGQEGSAYTYLGKIYETKFEFNKAEDFYSKAYKLTPNNKEIILRLSTCKMNAGKFEEASKLFEKGTLLYPMDTDLFTGWGMTYMRLGQYTSAKDKFKRAFKINKYNYSAILFCAIAEIRLKEYNDAEDKLSLLVKVAPNEGSLYEYANLNFLKSNYDKAIEYAKKTLDLNKQMLPAYYILSEAYSIKKDISGLQETFAQAISNGLENPVLYFEWGKSLIRVFDFQQAKEKFQKSLELDSEFTNAKIGIMLVEAYENKFDLYEQYKNIKTNVYVTEACGLYNLNSGNYKEAIENFKSALETDKNQTYNYLNLARAYHLLTNKEKAIDYYEKFLDINPESINTYIEYAKKLIEYQDFENAQRKLRKALRFDQNNCEILNLLFFTQYTIVKNKVCEYNIKEAIKIAEKIQTLGNFEYENEKSDLENILINIHRETN